MKKSHITTAIFCWLCCVICCVMIWLRSYLPPLLYLFLYPTFYTIYLLKIAPWQWHFTALWNETQHLWHQQSHFAGKWKKLNNIWWLWLQMFILFGKKCPYFYFKVPKLGIVQKRKRYWNWISKLSFMCILLAKL